LERGNEKQHRAVARWIEKLSTEERANLAKERIRTVAEQVYGLLQVHESNRILLYTSTVSSKIPRSFAANTFNLTKECLFRYQVIRLCALWDNDSGKERASLPVVAALIRDRRVRKLIACDRYSSRTAIKPRLLNPDPDPDLLNAQFRMNERIQERRGRTDARKALRGLRRCIRDIDKVEVSERLRSLRDFRNKHVAHCLQANATEVHSTNTLAYGQEEELLELTLRLVDQLALDLVDTNHCWETTKDYARRCASELWQNISFAIPGERMVR
jgi:hypothetical protein